MRVVLRHVGNGKAGRMREGLGSWCVHGAASHRAFLPASVNQRCEGFGARKNKCANTNRASNLVSRDAQRRKARALEIDWHVPESCDCIAVNRNAVLGRERGHGLDVVDYADLVVGPHHRDQSNL